MAPKRASPLDEPPTASSSSERENEGEEISSSREEQADHGEEEASSEEAEEDDAEDQPPKPSSTAPHTHNQPPSKNPPAQSSESISESDSGSDSGQRWVANPRVKPIASKPMQETPNSKPKPKPKKPAASSAKRPTENNVSQQQSDSKTKRAKKRVHDVAAPDGEVPAKGNDGKNGEDLSHVTKPREKKSLEGVDKTKAKDKSSGKAKKDQIQKEGGKTVASLKAEPNPKEAETEKMDVDTDKPCGSTMLSLSEMIRFDESVGLPGLSEDVIKRGLELIEASKRAELEARWKDLHVTELELYVKCAELIGDQAKMIWEAYKSSNH